MTTEHTPAEIAAAHRVLADDGDRRWDKLGFSGPAPMAEWHRKKADELDPPKPTWPDGTIALVTHAIGDSNPYQALAQYDADESEWVIERTHTGAACTVTGDSVTKVEPLRVLGDDEIALPRAAFDLPFGPRDSMRARQYAETAEFQRFSSAARVFRAYADALDAEAGDAK